MLLKLGYKNILRNKRRTSLTMLMMIFGFVLLSFTISLSDGAYSNIINKFINEETGEFQIHRQGYLKKPKIYRTISAHQPLLDRLLKDKHISSYSERVRSQALVFANDKTIGLEVIGIDFENESKSFNFKQNILEGSIPKSNLFYHIALGKKAAKKLGAKVNDELVFISNGADGSISNDIFKVKSIIGQKQRSKYDNRVYMPLHVSQEFFSMWGQVHEIAFRSKLDKDDFEDALKLKDDYQLSSWDEVEEDFYKAMLADRKGDYIFRFILMLVMAIGVLNAILMSILERNHEFGVLLAIGTKARTIFLLVILEVIIMTFLSVVIGAIISFGINYYMSIVGITYPEPIEYGGIVFDKMLSVVNYDSFVIPAQLIFTCSLLVSVFPAINVFKINPVEALR